MWLWWHLPSSLSHCPAETCPASTPGKAREAALARASWRRRHSHTGREKAKESRGFGHSAAHRHCLCLLLGFAPALSLLFPHYSTVLQAKVADMLGTGYRDHDQPPEKCSISSPSADYFRSHQKQRAGQFGSSRGVFMPLLEELRGWEPA